MKICVIMPNMLPVPCVKGGAIETLVTSLIDENEKEKKLDITIVSIWDEKAQIEAKKYANTKFIYIKKKDINYALHSVLAKTKNLFKNKYNTYNEVALSKIKNIPFDYIIVEGGNYNKFESFLKYFKKSQMIVHFHHCSNSDKNTDNTYSMYIGVSSYIANAFKKTSSIQDIQVLKNGIDIQKFDKSILPNERLEIRKSLGFSEKDFVVMFCGRLIKEKGVLELVQAIKRIKEENIKLMIVGSINFANNGTSEYLEKLNNEIVSLNEKIVLTGYVDRNSLYKYYKVADIGVMPSLCEEAAGLVAIENMVSRLPLIVTKVGGIPEYVAENTIMIENDENIVNNIEEAILKIYNANSIDKGKIIQTSYEHAKKFNTATFYNNFIQILQNKQKRDRNI